jgi:transposase-like protein
MAKKKTRRARRDRKQWAEIVKRFESSGLSTRDFCRREGLASSSLQRWRLRLRSAAVKPEFVELVPEAASSMTSSSWSLDVSLPNGVSLRFKG